MPALSITPTIPDAVAVGGHVTDLERAGEIADDHADRPPARSSMSPSQPRSGGAGRSRDPRRTAGGPPASPSPVVEPVIGTRAIGAGLPQTVDAHGRDGRRRQPRHSRRGGRGDLRGRRSAAGRPPRTQTPPRALTAGHGPAGRRCHPRPRSAVTGFAQTTRRRTSGCTELNTRAANQPP